MKKNQISIVRFRVGLNYKKTCQIGVFRLVSRVCAVSILFLVALLAGMKNDVVSGQTQRILKNPSELLSEKSSKRGGDQNFNLEIRYADNLIFNPSSGKNDKVRLRNYNGELVGPTMRVKPGQLLKINLMNKLPLDPSCQDNQDPSIPHCYNSTNLHTHGWHVSPTGNSDNVLLDIKPGTNLDYEYYLPKDHPAGTFWYHSHRHGSTALQVSSGMAGTLIVEGVRPYKDKAINGIADIDTILKDVNGDKFTDRIFMFEQIAYACLDSSRNIITLPPPPDNPNKSMPWVCPDGQVGEIEQYGPQFGPGTWGPSGRFTMINGMLQPLIETQTGKIERWRLIHGGVRDTINFRITRSAFQKDGTREEMNKILEEIRTTAPSEQKQLLSKYCKAGPGFDYNQSEFAVDGLTRKKMSNKTMNILQPGYRSDVLVAFDRPGIYCVLDDATPPAASLVSTEIQANKLMTMMTPKSVELNDTRLLSMVFVSGGTPFKEEPKDYIAKQLVAANQDLPEQVRKDLQQLSIPEYVPHPDIKESEITTKKPQELAFAIRIASDNTTTLFQIANKVNPQPLDYFSYDPSRIDRILPLGGVDEWHLTARFISHPFHIHVNPFQIIEILDPAGNSIIDKKTGKCVDNYAYDPVTKKPIKGPLDMQYCDQIGVWRDTLFVKQNPNFDSTGNSPGYLIKIRTRYERYIGDFVLHCHILDHEDGGMMQNVRIAPTGGYIEGNPVPTEGAKRHNH
jgi:FtsP/CotA-like multicopper oxidase with cupredoxin domain